MKIALVSARVVDRDIEHNLLQMAQYMREAKAQGAEMLITACPLCMYNLKENATEGLEVKYFTELLAEALGVKEDAQ